MKIKYVCPEGCRLTKPGVLKKTGGPLICRKHRLRIESKEIICLDCKKPTKIGVSTNGKVRCDTCQANRRSEKLNARKKKERAIAAGLRKSPPVTVAEKIQEKPTITTAKARSWPWARSVRKPECKRYDECFELVDYRKHNAKMNCGICACFQHKTEDAADYVTGELHDLLTRQRKAGMQRMLAEQEHGTFSLSDGVK